MWRRRPMLLFPAFFISLVLFRKDFRQMLTFIPGIIKNQVSAESGPYVSPGPYLVEYPYQYHFIMNEPQKCAVQKPFLVLVVHVAPQNRAHRDIIRKTWGSESVVLDKVVTVFFLLGLYTGEGGEQLREQLLQESKEHRDLIQSDFVDRYKNLTIKTMVMMEWLDAYCSNAFYAMKIDSDVFLNVPNLIALLSNAPKSYYMTGRVERGAEVLRNSTSKWFVPEEIYPQYFYPTYALGLGYIMSLDLPKKLVEAAKHIKALYIEDVYVGMCMEHLGIPFTDPPSVLDFNVSPVIYNHCAFHSLIATTVEDRVNLLSLWEHFHSSDTFDCDQFNLNEYVQRLKIRLSGQIHPSPNSVANSTHFVTGSLEKVGTGLKWANTCGTPMETMHKPAWDPYR
ncbi:beta-1,3-galactosyltransferase 1-like [Solea solea]|uniref:beta-1,3-galactosyltransferase 1-like n=1 Tax=Solea solea TaxID=90069 RepID=UPI00272D281E|nr:beta-1,3-galactosyltransferase 1-like [Solea solea]